MTLATPPLRARTGTRTFTAALLAGSWPSTAARSRQSQPDSVAIRMASTRFRAPVFEMARER